jgi:hypothetical protein
MCEKINARKIQVGKTAGKGLGRPMHRQDENIKINQRNLYVCVLDATGFRQVQWYILENTDMKISWI